MHNLTYKYINQAEGWQATCSCHEFTASGSTFRICVSLAIEHLEPIVRYA